MTNPFKPCDLVRFQGEDCVYLVESIQIPPVNCVLRGRKGYPARIGVLEHAVSIRKGNKVRTRDGLVRTVMDVVDCKVRCEQWHDVVDVTLVADDEGEAPSEAGARASTREPIAIGSGAIMVPHGSTLEAELRLLLRQAEDRVLVEKNRADWSEATAKNWEAEADDLRVTVNKARADLVREEDAHRAIIRRKNDEWSDLSSANARLRVQSRFFAVLFFLAVIGCIVCTVCTCMVTAVSRPQRGLPAGAWRWY